MIPPRIRSTLAEFALGVLIGIAIVAVVMLAGCATQPTLTTAVRTVTVDRPVAVPCIAPADIPAEPATAMPDSHAGVKRLAAGASADARAEYVYAAQLRAALIACSQQPAAGGKP